MQRAALAAASVVVMLARCRDLLASIQHHPPGGRIPADVQRAGENVTFAMSRGG